jgi:hypothetical protein
MGHHHRSGLMRLAEEHVLLMLDKVPLAKV